MTFKTLQTALAVCTIVISNGRHTQIFIIHIPDKSEKEKKIHSCGQIAQSK